MTTYSYDAASNLTGYAYPNTVQTGNVFDPLNRLTQTCVATTSPACSAGTKLASYAYTLGNAGNRTNVLELNSRIRSLSQRPIKGKAGNVKLHRAWENVFKSLGTTRRTSLAGEHSSSG